MNKVLLPLLWFLPTICLAGNLPLTLEGAINTALQNRPEMHMENIQLQISQSKINHAHGAFKPSLDLSSTAQRIKLYDDFTSVAITGQIGEENVDLALAKASPRYQVSSGLDLEYNLYSGGLNSAKLREAEAQDAAAHAQHGLTRRAIILEVARAYWELRKSQIRLQVASRKADYARAARHLADTQSTAGRISKIEHQSIALESDEKQILTGQEKLKLADAVRKYRLAVGMDLPDTYQPHELPTLADDSEAYEFFENQILHPQLQKAEAQLEAAVARVEAARATRRPKVDLFAHYGFVGRNDTRLASSLREQDRDYAALGIRLSLNLFDGSRTQENIAQALAEAELAKLQRRVSENELTASSREKTLNLALIEDEIKLMEQKRLLQTAKEKVAKVQLQGGLISEMEYREVLLTLEEIQDKLKSLKIDRALARLDVTMSLPGEKGLN